jgi:hypothetical protein
MSQSEVISAGMTPTRRKMKYLDESRQPRCLRMGAELWSPSLRPFRWFGHRANWRKPPETQVNPAHSANWNRPDPA